MSEKPATPGAIVARKTGKLPLPAWEAPVTSPASWEMADAGPGMEVPGDSTSHGRDSVNVSGHAIPAELYGNQYAVLFDTEPTELEDLDGF